MGATSISTLDFRILFESASGLYLVPAPDLTIVAAGEAYARTEDRVRAPVAGCQVHLPKPVEPMAVVASLVGRTGTV